MVTVPPKVPSFTIILLAVISPDAEIELNNTFGFNGTQNMYAIKTYFNIYKNLFKGYFNPVFKYKSLAQIQYSSSDLPIFKKEYI